MQKTLWKDSFLVSKDTCVVSIHMSCIINIHLYLQTLFTGIFNKVNNNRFIYHGTMKQSQPVNMCLDITTSIKHSIFSELRVKLTSAVNNEFSVLQQT